MRYVSGKDSRPSLASYIEDRLASGRLVFSYIEAQSALRLSMGAFLSEAEALQRRNRLLKLRGKLYAVVPSQHLNLGGPPPACFIDELMSHVKTHYYVGLWTAAALHGSSQQAATEFHVVTMPQVRNVPRAGPFKFVFHFRHDISAIKSGVEERTTDTGKLNISSVELTLFDLLRYSKGIDALNTISTVVSDLGPKINPERIEVLSRRFQQPILQRAGYLLDQSGFGDLADRLHRLLHPRPRIDWVELDPVPRGPDAAPEIHVRDRRWYILVRRDQKRNE